jgi:ABC-2 type transport system permease protein
MRHELLMTLRRKMFVFFAIGLPLILLIIALVVALVNRDRPEDTAESAPETAEIVTQGYVDYAGLVASEAPGIPPDSLLPYPDETAAAAALEAGEINGYFLIPAGYLEGGELTYVTAAYSPFSDKVQTRTIEWLVQTNLLGDVDKATAVWQPIIVFLTELDRPGAAVDEDSWIAALLPTLMMFIIYMTIIIPAGSLVNAVTDEKKNRVIESVLVSVSSRQFISGKILALGLLGLLQVVMWMGVVFVVVRFGGQSLNIPSGFTVDTSLLLWVIVYCLLGYAMYGVLMAGLGALVPDFKDARGASVLLLTPLIIVYMFNIVVVNRPNGLIAIFFSLFPLTAPVGMIGRMGATDVPLWQAVLSAGLQLATAVGLLLLVARLFQARYLLSGQPFSMKRYFAALAGRA